MTGFSDTVGGAPTRSYNASVTHWLSDDWQVTALSEFSITAADGSVSSTYGLKVKGALTSWLDGTVGAERQLSLEYNDTLAILGLDCDF